MDQVTFRSDTVLSDVHLLIPNARHLMVRLNAAGQPGNAYDLTTRGSSSRSYPDLSLSDSVFFCLFV